ncbi:MAG: ABC transporter permease, partial [Armatimonadota bacterium]|nr:ABC transporter permease [Armatimonadota bacterium]
VERDLRVRYKNSVLGIAWTMVNPLVQVFVLTVAISFILGAGPRNLSAFIFCATIPWTFFQTAILDSSTSVLAKLGLLKKVYFPREIPLIAAVCQNFVQFLISLGVFMVYRWGLTPLLNGGNVAPPREILWLPVVIVLLFLLTLGAAFFVATVNVFYEDVKFILTITMGFLFYLLPIIYFAENINYAPRLHNAQVRWWAYHLYLANPLAWIVTAFKQMFFNVQDISNSNAPFPHVHSAPFDWRYLLITAIISVAVCLGGYSFFNRHKWRFTERP